MRQSLGWHRSLAGAVLFLSTFSTSAPAQPLPSTQPLDRPGDLAAQMVAGIDAYLMRQLAASVEERWTFWKPDYASRDAYVRSVEPNRERLRQILGIVDRRLPITELAYVAGTRQSSLVAEANGYAIHAVRWPVFEGVDAEGLLLEPTSPPIACVVALPDADWSPEMLTGLAPGVPAQAQFARILAANGCRVLVPSLIDRADTWSGNPGFRMTNLPHREYLYRAAFELGRHVIGYEVQKVLAAIDLFSLAPSHPPIGVIGYGEGGLLALASAAVDPRIHATVVSGYFGPKERLWEEPIYRNVWAYLREFGDGGLAMLIAPRSLIIEASKGPEVAGPPRPHNGRSGAAPGKLVPVSFEAARMEANRVAAYHELKLADGAGLITLPADVPGTNETLTAFLRALTGRQSLQSAGAAPRDRRNGFDPAVRLHQQFDQLGAFTQRQLREAEGRRREFWSKADASSPGRWQASSRPYRDYFWEEVVGKMPAPSLPANPRTRLAYDEPRWKGYEVTLDLYPDVFAYGILLVPKDLKAGERRPVVVCQHGLEGRPQDVVNPRKRTPYYNSFGAQLADRGYIVYAPQNPYIGHDAFRVLQRKANPLKLSLFSFIIRQHERSLDWLAGLPFVDPARIGFYGLSYGGKTAMRVPAVLERYALSICSGDFNEWIWKNVRDDSGLSYLFSGEYEMFEFNLGNTFNYAEMAGLIAPRPFMVERGHDDGVGVDEWVAYEYAKVRRLYAKLGLPERTAIEFFPGGHLIHGQETFTFLDRFLREPGR
jgi:dienelactone hydrolase